MVFASLEETNTNGLTESATAERARKWRRVSDRRRAVLGDRLCERTISSHSDACGGFLRGIVGPSFGGWRGQSRVLFDSIDTQRGRDDTRRSTPGRLDDGIDRYLRMRGASRPRGPRIARIFASGRAPMPGCPSARTLRRPALRIIRELEFSFLAPELGVLPCGRLRCGSGLPLHICRRSLTYGVSTDTKASPRRRVSGWPGPFRALPSIPS